MDIDDDDEIKSPPTGRGSEGKEHVRWLSCIGIFTLNQTVGPCLIMLDSNSNTSALFCVVLDATTSFLLSPCFAHKITLLTCRPSPEEQRLAILEHFYGATYCRLVERLAFQCLLPTSQMTEKETIAVLTNLVRHTLFVQAHHCHLPTPRDNLTFAGLLPFTGNRKAQNHVFFSHERDKEMEVLESCLSAFDNVLTLNARKKAATVVAEYWKQMNQNHGEILNTAISQLIKYTSKSKLYDAMGLHRLLDQWSGYEPLGRYFTNQYLTMHDNYVLYNLFKQQPTLFNMASLSQVQMHDLVLFSQALLSLKSFKEVFFTDYFSLLLHVLRGRFYEVASLLFADKLERTKNRDDMLVRIRSYLVDTVLVPTMIIKLEHQARTNATYNKASICALTVQQIHSTYVALVKLHNTNVELGADYSISLEQQEPPVSHTDSEDDDADNLAAKKQQTPLFVYSVDDFTCVLRVLYKQIQENQHGLTMHKWIIKQQNSKSNGLIDHKTSLFFVAPNKPLLESERDNHQIYAKYLRALTTATLYHQAREPLDVSQWQQNFVTAKNRFLSQSDEPHALETYQKMPQQFHYVFFTPLELRQNADLELIAEVLHSDRYCTAVLREEKVNLMYQTRMSQFFTKHATLGEWFSEWSCAKSCDFMQIDPRCIRETVIVTECHQLSNVQLHNLLKWFYYHHQTIKRVLMLGSLHLLPSYSDGQAFVDMVRDQDALLCNGSYAKNVNGVLFDHDETSRQFSELAKEGWAVIRWPTQPLNMMREEISAMRKKHDLCLMQNHAIIYEVVNRALLHKILEYMYADQRSVSLQCLYRQPYGGTAMAMKTNPLYSYMSAGGLSSGVTYNALDFADLIKCNTTRRSSRDKTHFFAITRKTLLALDKNEVTLLLTVVPHCLFVITEGDLAPHENERQQKQKPDKDVLNLLVEQHEKSMRYNVRYSYSSLQ